MKKGVSDLIAWVLLIGFAVSLGVFVTRWSLQQAEKSTSGVEAMGEEDIQCTDVAIRGYCDGNNIKIKNKGTLNIIGFRKDNTEDMFENNPLAPNVGEKIRDASTEIVIIPIIRIEEKKVICTSQRQEFICA